MLFWNGSYAENKGRQDVDFCVYLKEPSVTKFAIRYFRIIVPPAIYFPKLPDTVQSTNDIAKRMFLFLTLGAQL